MSVLVSQVGQEKPVMFLTAQVAVVVMVSVMEQAGSYQSAIVNRVGWVRIVTVLVYMAGLMD